MAGTLLLAGGGEFQKGFEVADQTALELAGAESGGIGAVLVLAVASGLRRATEMAQEGSVWFTKLGAAISEGLALTDHTEANDPANAARIAQARLIYLVGGDPAYIPAVLRDSASLAAIQKVFAKGGVVAGSGSGAMALAQYLYHEEKNELIPGLNFVPDCCVIPYHTSRGRKWSKKLVELLPTAYVLGLDEKIAIIGADNNWRVNGRGWVTVYKGSKTRKFVSGQPFALNPKKI